MCNHITPSRSHAQGLISRARGSTSLVVRRSTRAATSSRIEITTSQYKYFSSGISAQIATGQVRYMLPHLGSRSLPSERMIRCVITSHPADVMLMGSFPVPKVPLHLSSEDQQEQPHRAESTTLQVSTSTSAQVFQLRLPGVRYVICFHI